MPDSRPMSARVRDQLIELFHARHLGPGDRVPSEAEIAELCGVGRSTAREALKLLEQDGMVLVERGRGRFLSSLSALHIERPVTRFEFDHVHARRARASRHRPWSCRSPRTSRPMPSGRPWTWAKAARWSGWNGSAPATTTH